CETVGLQFQAHRQTVRALHRLAALRELLFRVHDAELILYVMADLVRDHVGAREVAVGVETRRELLEEIEVEVHALVAGAVERPDRRRGTAAGRGNLAVEQHQLGIDVLLAHLLEIRGPDILGTAEDLADELHLRITVVDLRCLRRDVARTGFAVAGEQSEDDPARGREDHRDDDRDDGAAQPEVDAADAGTTAAARPFHVVAGTPFLPKHADSPFPQARGRADSRTLRQAGARRKCARSRTVPRSGFPFAPSAGAKR